MFYAFDLLWLNGEDLRNVPLIERKQNLCELIRTKKAERIIYAQQVEGDGKVFFQEICNNDLEIICYQHPSQSHKHKLVSPDALFAAQVLRDGSERRLPYFISRMNRGASGGDDAQRMGKDMRRPKGDTS